MAQVRSVPVNHVRECRDQIPRRHARPRVGSFATHVGEMNLHNPNAREDLSGLDTAQKALPRGCFPKAAIDGEAEDQKHLEAPRSLSPGAGNCVACVLAGVGLLPFDSVGKSCRILCAMHSCRSNPEAHNTKLTCLAGYYGCLGPWPVVQNDPADGKLPSA